MVYLGYHNNQSPSIQRTAIIVGVVVGIIVIIVGWTCFCLRGGRKAHGNDIEAQRDQHRAMNRNWYRQPTPRETTVERRARQAREARIARGEESGVETQARRDRETREADLAPPVYQLPVPAHHSVLQSSVAERPLPVPSSTSLPKADAPPAYDSPAVWGAGR